MSDARVFVQNVPKTERLEAIHRVFEAAIKSVKKSRPKSYKSTKTYKAARAKYKADVNAYVKATQNQVYELTPLVKSVSWDTYIAGQPGKASVRMVKPPSSMNLGAYLAIRTENGGLFLGKIFRQEITDNEEVELVAYDQMRYLQNKDSFVFKKGMTASQIFAKVCKSYALAYRVMNASTYKIPGWIADGKSLYDMVELATDMTLIKKGKWYIIRDEYGVLRFWDIYKLRKPLYITNNDSVTGYAVVNSIEDDTFTRVKLYKEDSKGNRYSYTTTDADRVLQYGILQYMEKVDDSKTKSWMRSRAKAIIAAKKRMTTTFEIDCTGDDRLRAGDGIVLSFPELNSWGVKDKGYYFIDTCEHRWENGNHTMKLTMRMDFRG